MKVPKYINTTVDANKTAYEVQHRISQYGTVIAITLEYDPGGFPAALLFKLPVWENEVGEFKDYRLPCRLDRMVERLEELKVLGKVQTKKVTMEHAARVSWRILQDWVKAQFDIIDSGLVTFDEVMSPYEEKTEQKALTAGS